MQRRSSVVSVTTSATRILQNDPNRVFWVAMNRSVNNGAVGFNREVTFANGLLVGAGGGFVESDIDDDGEAIADEVFAINNSAAGDWRIVEIRRV